MDRIGIDLWQALGRLHRVGLAAQGHHRVQLGRQHAQQGGQIHPFAVEHRAPHGGAGSIQQPLGHLGEAIDAIPHGLQAGALVLAGAGAIGGHEHLQAGADASQGPTQLVRGGDHERIGQSV